jgi:hypothetical protein
MAKASIQLLLILFLLPAVSGLSFNINVGELTDHSVKDLDYSENISVIQDVNATVRNVGSIGCTYRMRADFQQSNESFKRFSNPRGLWQGDYARMEVNYIPTNYTGQVQTNLSVEYCGQKNQVESFSFNVTEKTLINQTVESRTISSEDEEARVEVEGDLLVPEEEPSYWKTSTAKIINGTAKIQYDAPIFDQREEIKYTVLDNGEIRGTTTVSLTLEPTLKEKILDRKLEIISGVLAISILANILLVLKQKGVLAKIRSIEYELPDFKKQE